MSYQFTISDIGLRLIKAYEGYRAEPRTLASGNRVIGFGHAVDSDDVSALSEEDAEAALKADLAPIEDLINSRVHASMTQSQFDALCSLAFSIGEKSFMASNILHAMNKGQVIEAANGFDLWRKGNIDGQVYVVDALVRRRTAEKALFLRPTQRTARAPRYELTAIKDDDLSEDEGVVELAAAAPGFQAANIEDSAGFSDVSMFQDNDVIDDDDLDMELVQNIQVTPSYPVEVETSDDGREEDDETTRRGLAAAPVAVLYSEDDILETPVVNMADEDEIIDLDMVAAPPTGALSETFPESTLTPVSEPTVTDFVDSVEDDIEDMSEGIADTVSDTVADIQDGVEEGVDVAVQEDPVQKDIVDVEAEDTPVDVETSDQSDPSPIAAAAAEVSGRLDALIDEPSEPENETEWPESLITASIKPESADIASDTVPADVVIDELHRDDALRDQDARDSQFNTDRYVEYTNGRNANPRGGLWAFFTMMIVGLTLLLSGLGLNLKGALAVLGENGPFITIAAMAIGGLLLVGGGWYLIKALFFKD